MEPWELMAALLWASTHKAGNVDLFISSGLNRPMSFYACLRPQLSDFLWDLQPLILVWTPHLQLQNQPEALRPQTE